MYAWIFSASAAEGTLPPNCEAGTFCTVTTQAEIDANSNHAPVTVIAIDSQNCIYCKIMEPVIKELATEYKGRVQFLKLDQYYNVRLAFPLQNRGTPNYFMFNHDIFTGNVLRGAPVSDGLIIMRELPDLMSMTQEEKMDFVRPYGKRNFKLWLDPYL